MNRFIWELAVLLNCFVPESRRQTLKEILDDNIWIDPVKDDKIPYGISYWILKKNSK